MERTMPNTRKERDPLGDLDVPSDALYGVQTQRAVQNFPISGLKPLAAFVDAVIWIKKAAALTHRETGRLEAKLADAIVQAADPAPPSDSSARRARPRRPSAPRPPRPAR